jgi:hypothetical protein
MRYMLFLYANERELDAMTDEVRSSAMQAHMAYAQALAEAGAHVDGAPLQGSESATLVQVRDDETLTTDGPYAETKEQLAGYYLIEAETLDEALEWAARCPAALHGTIEVRPVIAMPSGVSA